jgi:tetratricopeptide (TPR) repeat protein
MTDTCLISRDERIARYVARTLPGDDVDELEIHILGCADCQRAVREAAGLRVALEDLAERPSARAAGPAAARLPWLLGPAVAAAVVAWFLLTPKPDLRRLGGVDVTPPFDGVTTRAAEAPTSPAVTGMMAYQAGEYARAAALLDEARRTDPTPGAHFFSGVSHLMTGNVDAAVGALQSALEPSESAYASEARFYLAKALLRDGDGEAALTHLEAVPPGTGLHDHAQALADSIRAALR